ncbi:hypothetical protein KPL71_026940 [Citrus sinensis]|uniref:Uncharacterized protein n=1 Tax=Citrus sinensis TaxID=2711 RepID=A0ACB8I2R1_CITSI|nr:hypothetical protein KPL71_026940 [Citrus sinensis]
MATLNDSTFREGQSTTRPPFFDGNDYAYWKTRMRIYLQALDYEIWEVVCDGPFLPLIKNEFGEDIPKPSREWNELEKRKAFLNSKAMNALFCALDKKEFHRVSSCESANEIWHKLEVVYEGTNQVKESKISRYTRQYELFQMEQNESVYSMYMRFTDIVNTLGALGKTFSNSEKVKKIIRTLPKEWRPKRTAIEEAKDLNALPLDDLIGSLISYEEDLVAEKGHEEKKKSIALKTSKYESDGESEPNDEELAMLAMRFRKFFMKIGERRNFRNFKNQREKKEVITCYECKKPSHIRSECPLINKLKKKAMVATWDDREEDSSDEERSKKVSNLALMAIGRDDDLNEGLKKKKNKWYLDNGCSRQMTGNYAWFSSFTKTENGGDVSFGDNSKGKILGIGNVGKVSSTLIENILFVGNRCGNVYIIDIKCASTLDKCFSALHDDSWLWHRRLGHASFGSLRDLLLSIPPPQKGSLSSRVKEGNCCCSTVVSSQIASSQVASSAGSRFHRTKLCLINFPPHFSHRVSTIDSGSKTNTPSSSTATCFILFAAAARFFLSCSNNSSRVINARSTSWTGDRPIRTQPTVEKNTIVVAIGARSTANIVQDNG